MPRLQTLRRIVPLMGALLAPFLASGCRDGMANQPKLRPYRKSDFFAGGASARPLVPGTVPRGFLREEQALYTGLGADGKFAAELPLELTRELLARGRERFDIFCSPCHGKTGTGEGMVVERGFKRPSSFHIDRLRNERIGYFFDVMTKGFAEMSSYASQVSPEDRWAIAAYIRALELSQNAPAALLAASDLASLEAAARGSSPAPEEGK
jgi:mono/diheme cytochrome c family protein